MLTTHHEFDKRDVQGRRRAVAEVIREANASAMHSGHEHLRVSVKAQLSLALSKSFVQYHGKGSPSTCTHTHRNKNELLLIKYLPFCVTQ
jgi:hypothetical protein